MLTSILTAALLASTAPGASPERHAAAEILRSALAERDDARLALLLERGRDAAARIAGARAGGQLAALLDEAEAADEPDAALRRLEAELAVLAEDLAFEPLLEAELPRGFPGPTPVREIETKRYPGYRMVRAAIEGADGATSQGAFWKLFTHITRHDIAMTAPVEMAYTDEGDALRESAMAFLYAEPELGELGPDGPVDVVDVAPARVASLGCRGRTSAARIDAARAELLAWIDARPELAVDGALRVMSYNSPRVPTARRYFEVQVPVRGTSEIVVDFTLPDEAERWGPIDDVVMGGRSSSRLERTADGTCAFAGEVSLANGGGFASVRSRELRADLGGASEVVVRARGDGRTYRLRLFPRGLPADVAYQASFATVAGEWTDHAFAAADFAPSRRGRPVPGAPPLDLREVTSVGLLIADEQAGPFRLELRSIEKR